jgi:hypothetical protein
MSGAVRVPLMRCPVCGNENDATTSTTAGAKRVPKPGDYGLCVGCGALMEFDADLRCFIPEPEAVAANMLRQEGLAAGLFAAQQAIFARNKRNTHH